MRQAAPIRSPDVAANHEHLSTGRKFGCVGGRTLAEPKTPTSQGAL